MLSVTGAAGTCSSTTPHPAYPIDSSALGALAARVDTAHTELMTQYALVAAQRPTDDHTHAVRARRLALLTAREAGWWSVLLIASRGHRVDPVWRRAVVQARGRTREHARFWRDSAADWQARADHQPTSDAAGALSNWAELGITP